MACDHRRHFVRPHTIDPNPHVYSLIDQHADHFHWDTAKDWSDSRNALGEHDRKGGGHAHSGLMIYQGDQWPASMRGDVFTLNFHGRRLNEDRLERVGSGYEGKHEPDPMYAADPFFRGIDLASGPDGGVFVLDWSDTGECHEQTGVHRSSGRIFKITYGDGKPFEPVDLTRLGELGLVKLQTHANDWFARQGRRELADRSARGEGLAEAKELLHDLFRSDPNPVHKLRAVWSLYCIGGTDEALLQSMLKHDHESIRSWGVRLLTDRLPLDLVTGGRPSDVASPLAADLARMSNEDRSGLVRLVLASTMQRLPVANRAEIAAGLASRSEDATDHNMPLMVWYGLIPVADSNPRELADLAPAAPARHAKADRPPPGRGRREESPGRGPLARSRREEPLGCRPNRHPPGPLRRAERLAKGAETARLGRLIGHVRPISRPEDWRACAGAGSGVRRRPCFG